MIIFLLLFLHYYFIGTISTTESITSESYEPSIKISTVNSKENRTTRNLISCERVKLKDSIDNTSILTTNRREEGPDVVSDPNVMEEFLKEAEISDQDLAMSTNSVIFTVTYLKEEDEEMVSDQNISNDNNNNSSHNISITPNLPSLPATFSNTNQTNSLNRNTSTSNPEVFNQNQQTTSISNQQIFQNEKLDKSTSTSNSQIFNSIYQNPSNEKETFVSKERIFRNQPDKLHYPSQLSNSSSAKEEVSLHKITLI